MPFEHEDGSGRPIETIGHPISNCQIQNCRPEMCIFEEICLSRSPTGTNFLFGQSQRADGQTKILFGQALKQLQQHLKLFPAPTPVVRICYVANLDKVSPKISTFNIDLQEAILRMRVPLFLKSDNSSKKVFWGPDSKGQAFEWLGGAALT